MQSAVDAWKANLANKIEELRNALREFATNREEKRGREVKAHLDGLKTMFSATQIPQPLRALESRLSAFASNGTLPQNLIDLIHSYDELPSVASFADTEPPSFDEIFASYKKDKELDTLANELIGVLERILSEADDVLSAHIARELRTILEELKKRERRSLYELQNWVDLGMRALLVVAETYTGTHGLALIYEATKIAYRIRKRLHYIYGDAQKHLLEDRKLSFVQQAVDRIPEITPDQEKKLLAPPDESAKPGE